MNEFAITLEVRGSAIIAHLRGEATNVYGPMFAGAMTNLIVTGQKTVVIDMAGLTFIATRGLSELVGLNGRLRTHGRTLSLANVPEPIESMLRVSHLRDLLPEFGTVDDAIAGTLGTDAPRPGPQAAR